MEKDDDEKKHEDLQIPSIPNRFFASFKESSIGIGN
jgi:hypothetical protein